MWMCLGRNLRGSLWKEVEVLHCGSGLGVSVCVVCWKEWRFVVGVSLLRGLLKAKRMDVGSLN